MALCEFLLLLPECLSPMVFSHRPTSGLFLPFLCCTERTGPARGRASVHAFLILSVTACDEYRLCEPSGAFAAVFDPCRGSGTILKSGVVLETPGLSSVPRFAHVGGRTDNNVSSISMKFFRLAVDP